LPIICPTGLLLKPTLQESFDVLDLEGIAAVRDVLGRLGAFLRNIENLDLAVTLAWLAFWMSSMRKRRRKSLAMWVAALHNHFVEAQRPVPGFLIPDQPSQVYFPSLEAYQTLPGTTEDTLRSDGDVDAVRRMFQLLFTVCKSLAPNFQVT